jgi:hypothetical protein
LTFKIIALYSPAQRKTKMKSNMLGFIATFLALDGVRAKNSSPGGEVTLFRK